MTKSWEVCDKCQKVLDNDFSNYCNECREKYHHNIKKERKRYEDQNDKFWDNR